MYHVRSRGLQDGYEGVAFPGSAEASSLSPDSLGSWICCSHSWDSLRPKKSLWCHLRLSPTTIRMADMTAQLEMYEWPIYNNTNGIWHKKYIYIYIYFENLRISALNPILIPITSRSVFFSGLLVPLFPESVVPLCSWMFNLRMCCFVGFGPYRLAEGSSSTAVPFNNGSFSAVCRLLFRANPLGGIGEEYDGSMTPLAIKNITKTSWPNEMIRGIAATKDVLARIY